MAASSGAKEHDKNSGQQQLSCNDCDQADKCRLAWSGSLRRPGTFSGAGLALGSGVALLLPLLTGVITTALAYIYLPRARTCPLWELAAAGAGFLSGTALACVIMPLIRNHFHE